MRATAAAAGKQPQEAMLYVRLHPWRPGDHVVAEDLGPWLAHVVVAHAFDEEVGRRILVGCHRAHTLSAIGESDTGDTQ